MLRTIGASHWLAGLLSCYAELLFLVFVQRLEVDYLSLQVASSSVTSGDLRRHQELCMDECLFSEQIYETKLCLIVVSSMGAYYLVFGLDFCLWKAGWIF